ncbi:MAG: GNAT family N-acetyltransferase [Hyphomicrobiales bacterium]
MSVPYNPLRGPRVELRAPEPEDRALLQRWLSDPEVMRFNEVRYPRSLAELQAEPPATVTYEHAAFAVWDVEAGRRIGESWLKVPAPENRAAEFGILLGPQGRGRGLGAETTWLTCRFGFEMMNLRRIELRVLAENERASALYQRLGFQREGRLRDSAYFAGRYEDVLVMSLLAGELGPPPWETTSG